MISFPYSSLKTLEGNTLKYDRAIDSKIKRLYNKLRYTQGVAVDIGGGFQVVADTGMNVKVNCNGSWAHVGGNFGYEEAESRTLTAQAPDSTYDRIDMVVLRNDISQEVRAMDLYIVQGTPASSPKVPSLTNTPEIQEICLATLFISRGVNTISQDRISDTRLNSEVCGVLTNAFGEIDASQFFAQLEQLAKDLQDEIKRINAGSEVMLKATYDPDNLNEDLGIQLYTHSKSGTVHNFVGTGMNGRAKITAAFNDGDTVQLNGTPVTATCGADPVDGDTIVNGKWVSFVADAEGGQINFKGGGGLGNTKLAQATAEPEDVVSGETFYAGEKEIKSGTLQDMASVVDFVNMSNNANGNCYVRINKGAYRTSSSAGYPEIRIPKADVLNTILAITKHTAQEVQGDDKTTTKTAAVSKDQVWLFVTFVGSGSGATSSLSTPNATTYVDLYENVTRQEDDPMRLLRIRVCKFNAAGTVTATLHTGQGWASTYFAFIKLA